ncbi:MAG: S41 family peptidase, partial [Limisphaerales bacterium]
MKKLILLSALMTVLSGARGNDKTEPDAADNLAAFLFSVSDVVMDHELEAPPRQQLLHLSLRKFAERHGQTLPRLNRQISSITTSGQLAVLLRRVSSPAKGLQDDKDTRKRLLDGLNILNPATGFGGATYQEAHDYKVAKQLNENRYVGIGIALSMTSRDGTGRPVVGRLLGKGPAFYSGLLKGDQMYEIDGRDTAGKSLREVLLWLRGEEGSKVELIVRQRARDPKRKVVITRSVVPIQSAAGWSEDTPGEHEYRIEDAPEFAYVRIDQITGATLNELQALEPVFAELGIKGVVFDLRNTNPTQEGGVHHVCMLADGLIPGGQLGSIHEHGRPRELKAGRDAVFRNLPMVAMVGPATRGAAEWLAAALQDNERAL